MCNGDCSIVFELYLRELDTSDSLYVYVNT
nr:MAG TPA: hypothetical protein [Caudoviricetes sp.]